MSRSQPYFLFYHGCIFMGATFLDARLDALEAPQTQPIEEVCK